MDVVFPEAAGCFTRCRILMWSHLPYGLHCLVVDVTDLGQCQDLPGM